MIYSDDLLLDLFWGLTWRVTPQIISNKWLVTIVSSAIHIEGDLRGMKTTYGSWDDPRNMLTWDSMGNT